MSTSHVPRIETKSLVRKELKKFRDKLKEHADVSLANKLLGDKAADWAGKTWLIRTWNEITRHRMTDYGNDLHFRRVLRQELKDSWRHLHRDVNRNVFGYIVLDLANQAMDYGAGALFAFRLALELATVRKEIPVHIGLLNFVYKNRDRFGSLEVLRGHHDGPSLETQAIWGELDEIRDSVKSMDEAKDLTSTVSTLTDTYHDLEVEVAAWHMATQCGRKDESSRWQLEVRPDADSRVARLISSKWRKLEEKVRCEVTELLGGSEEKQRKCELWNHQNLIEASLENAICENSGNPGLMEYKMRLKYYRPALRGEMAYLISFLPDFADLVYQILDQLMLREWDAFGFLRAADALSRNRKFIQPLREILHDLERDEPQYYKTPDDIVNKMTEFEITPLDVSGPKYQIDHTFARRKEAAKQLEQANEHTDTVFVPQKEVIPVRKPDEMIVPI